LRNTLLRDFGFAAVLAVLVGCSDEGSTGPSPDAVMTASLSDFAPNSPVEGSYELWISFALLRETDPGPRHSEAASAGKFRIDGSGRPVDLEGGPIAFEIRPEDPSAQVDEDGDIVWQLAADAFITVEAAEDDDNVPNLPALIAGGFENGVSALRMDQGDALRVDLTQASGSFLLATPTTLTTADETQGVWFVEPDGAPGSLNLETLLPTELWTYAGWVEDSDGTTVSLGTFHDPSGPDSDGAGPLGGAASGYDFPGSDFPFGVGTEVSAATIFITLEPPGDADGPGSFSLPILSAPANGAAPNAPVEMTRALLDFPRGTVEIPFSAGV
jgi:hypothetical protein